MRICHGCKKKVYGGKNREVILTNQRVQLCPDCGQVSFKHATGTAITGLLQSVNHPSRKTHSGRNISFHTETPLTPGDRLLEGTLSSLPGTKLHFPSNYNVYHVHPMIATETVPAEKEGDKPRKKKRTIGYAVKAHSL